jgi:hypothetical protein
VIGHRLKGGSGTMKEKYAGSASEHLVNRLVATDVVNRGMPFPRRFCFCASFHFSL